MYAGANVYLLARGKAALEKTRTELSPLRRSPTQWIRTHTADLGDASQVQLTTTHLYADR